MPSSQQPETLRVQRSTSATPEEAWALIAARFRGTNQMGSKKWRSNGTVTACEPGRRFAFHVSIGPFSVADWAYEVEPTEEGCVVTELWQDLRGALVTTLSPFITGTKDRARRNEQTMTVTLDRLAAYTNNPEPNPS